MSNNKTGEKKIALAFAEWVRDECFFNVTGYCMYDDGHEYQLDELCDYWYENIYQSNPTTP
jgi:hypothetical protein